MYTGAADVLSYNFYFTVSEWELAGELRKDISVSQLPISYD